MTYRQIRDGGPAVLLRKAKKLTVLFRRAAIWAVMGPVSIVVVLGMRALRPLVLVRVGQIRSDRIGHFGVDAPLHLADQTLRAKAPRIVDLFYISKETCNDQWAKMARRHLSVYWWVRYLVIVNQWFPSGVEHQTRSVNGSRDIEGLFHKTDVRFAFTDEEDLRVKQWLGARGWRKDESIVCLLARDSKYMATKSDNNWSYHNYRDTDIDTFNQAIMGLVEQGHWVVRMGKTMHRPLSCHHPRIIDYPFVDDQNDLIDIWLAAHCRFFISTATGLDSIPDAYGLPTVYVNALPLGLMKSYAHIIWVPKNLIWKKTGRPLTLREHLAHPHLQSEQYEKAGIDIVDLSDECIRLTVDEMEQRLSGTWQDTTDDVRRQTMFWEIFKSHPNFEKFHGWIHPQARAGTHWLRAMGDDFLA